MAQIKTGDVIAERYRVEQLLGVGGMATVFAVRELGTERRLAVKVLNEVLRRHPTIPKRFLQEARAARALTTPFAVKMEATGDLVDGTPFILMEFLEGMDLTAATRQAGGKLTVERALYLGDQIAEALQDAHSKGVLHRDLKPDNVFVVPTSVGEMIKVMDFGISKILAPGEVNKITVTGTTVGTPQYMPIEQLRGAKDLDGRVDVYALGVLLYELLAGLRPFDGFSYEEVIMKVATQTAPSLATYRADLPAALVDVIMRAMARDRNQRIASMDDLRRELRPFWSGNRPNFPLVETTVPDLTPPVSAPMSAGSTVSMDDPKQVARVVAAAAQAFPAEAGSAPGRQLKLPAQSASVSSSQRIVPSAPVFVGGVQQVSSSQQLSRPQQLSGQPQVSQSQQLSNSQPIAPAPAQMVGSPPKIASSPPSYANISDSGMLRPSDPRVASSPAAAPSPAVASSSMQLRPDPRLLAQSGYITASPVQPAQRSSTAVLIIGIVIGAGVVVVLAAAAIAGWMYLSQADSPPPAKSAPAASQSAKKR